MKERYLLTGASGHLGGTLARLLSARGAEVRGLLLPGETGVALPNVSYFHGDVRDPSSLVPFFDNTSDCKLIVIHTAGIVDISMGLTPLLRDVNVGGTQNVLALCRQFHAARLVYVSSVHAIPEKRRWETMGEVAEFSPDRVTGGYAKTKAEATQLVLDAAAQGLDAVVVHPSGIVGPYDAAGNHLVQLIRDYLRGRLPACVSGGYDFVDVRDVAEGCLAAAARGVPGRCYILSNRYYEIRELLEMVRAANGGRRLPVLPVWMAKMAEPLLRLDAKRKKERPLYTAYSLRTLVGSSRFSHDRATRELGYYPRDLTQTVTDTVAWLRASGAAKPSRQRVSRRRKRATA